MRRVVYLLAGFLVLTSQANALDAHEHGAVKLEILLDKKSVALMLHTPSESILEFEHKARTKSELKKVESNKALWKKDPLAYLGMVELKDCKVVQSFWKQSFSGKNHSSIEAQAQLQCEKSLKGRKATIGLKKKFHHVDEVKVQLIGNDGKAKSLESHKKTFSVSF